MEKWPSHLCEGHFVCSVGMPPETPRPLSHTPVTTRAPVVLRAQRSGEVRGICGCRARRGRRRTRCRREVFVIRLVHRLAVPVRAALSGKRVTEVVERLEEIGDDRMCAVLVADDAHESHLPEEDRPPVGIRLAQFGVEALDHPLGQTRGMARPGRRAQHEDVGGEDLLADARPLVAVSHIGLDTRLHIVVCDADRLADHTMTRQRLHDLIGHEVAARLSRRGLERRDKGNGGERRGSHILMLRFCGQTRKGLTSASRVG